MEKAVAKLAVVQRLHSTPGVHYSCAQLVLIPFARECGLTERQARDLGAHFGGGMHMGACCGALTAGLMVLGLAGRDEAAADAFRDFFRARWHAVDCGVLTADYPPEPPEARKAFCDPLIDAVVTWLGRETT